MGDIPSQRNGDSSIGYNPQDMTTNAYPRNIFILGSLKTRDPCLVRSPLHHKDPQVEGLPRHRILLGGFGMGGALALKTVPGRRNFQCGRRV